MSPNLYLIKFDEIHRVFAVWGSCNSMYDINRATKADKQISKEYFAFQLERIEEFNRYAGGAARR
jgi:hypothetical protein